MASETNSYWLNSIFHYRNMPMKLSSRSSPGGFLSCMPLVAVVSLWILICVWTSEGLLQDQYIGCFYDKSQMTDDLSAYIPPDNALTIEKCIAHCLPLNTTFASLQNGNVCNCRHDYGVQLGLPDSSCYLPCSGNQSEICGGFIGQQIAYSLYTVCPIGTYGASCDKGCHCKRDIHCERVTGDCRGGCNGNWSGPACNIATVSHQYIGCYKDDSTPGDANRALGLCIYCGVKDRDRKITITSCSQLCAEKNYSYAGLQNSWECFCGDSYDRYETSTACNMSCSGDSKAICGGGNANSVYSVCPIGNYGKSCAGRCHCLNNNRCIYRNGSCPSSQCKEGWTGTSCNIRDCTKNNGDCDINETCSAINMTHLTISKCRCPNGFQRTNIWGHCTDIDECSMKEFDNDTMLCTNTIGSYSCSCRSGFQTHNATACIGERAITAGVIGLIIGGALSLVIAFALLQICRRKCHYCATSVSKSSKSISPEPNGGETGHDFSRPSKPNVEDSSRYKQPCDKGISAHFVNLNAELHEKLRRSAKDEAALNAASDDNTYESLNAGVSGFDETGIYAVLKL